MMKRGGGGGGEGGAKRRSSFSITAETSTSCSSQAAEWTPQPGLYSQDRPSVGAEPAADDGSEEEGDEGAGGGSRVDLPTRRSVALRCEEESAIVRTRSRLRAQTRTGRSCWSRRRHAASAASASASASAHLHPGNSSRRRRGRSHRAAERPLPRRAPVRACVLWMLSRPAESGSIGCSFMVSTSHTGV